MSNVSIPNNDQTPNQFQAPSWILNELPTSSKLQAWSNQEAGEFGLLSEVVGNTFYNGIPNLAGSAGVLAQLTVAQSDGTIAFPSPQFNGTTSLNEMLIQNITGTSNPYLVTLASGGTISTSNIVVDSSNTSLYLIINAMLVTKNGSGVITSAYPAVFRPTFSTSTPNNTPINQFYVYFDNAVSLPLSNAYMEVANFSLSTAVAQSLLNIGGLQYGRIQGYTSGSDITSIIPNTGALPSLTQEINSIENKQFVTQWHAIVNQTSKTGTTGASFVWSLNSATVATVWQNGSLPAQGTVVQALTYAPNSIGQASAILAAHPEAPYASINGIPILYSNGTQVIPGINIAGGTVQLTLPSSIFASSPISNQNIDIYFPVQVPYRMLFMNAFVDNNLGSRMTDLLTGVIGTQYGWNNTTSPYNSTPVTIATRLDTDEANLIALSTKVIGFNTSGGGAGSVNITINFPAPQTIGWMEFIIGGAGGAGGGGDSNSGGNQGPGTAGGGGGGTGQIIRGVCPVQNGWVVTGSPAGAPGGFSQNGGTTVLNIGPYFVTAPGGNGGGGARANVGFGAGSGGSGGAGPFSNIPGVIFIENGSSPGTYGMSFMAANGQQRAPGGVGGFSGISGGQFCSGGNGGNGGEPANGSGQNTSWTAGCQGYTFVRF